MSSMWIQYLILEGIYGQSMWPIITFFLIFITSLSNETLKQVKDKAYNNVYWIRKSCFYGRKLKQVIMMKYKKMKFCNFETSWEISNKTKYKKQSRKYNTQYYYQRKSKSINIINQEPVLRPLIHHSFTSIAHTSEHSPNQSPHEIHFDTDSYQIGVDNRTSFTMTPSINDFVSPITPVKELYVQGIGGRLKVIGKGTIAWKINDDEGIVHEIIIPNTLYVKNLPYRLLSPQHWGQVSDDHSPKRNGTICITTANELILQ